MFNYLFDVTHCTDSPLRGLGVLLFSHNGPCGTAY